jgi:hypothetical protein
MALLDRNKNLQGLRVIKTARDKDSINNAAKSGLMPLIKKVESSDKIRSKYSVVQNKKTGEIDISGDYRSDYRRGLYSDETNDFETVIDWTFYYPYSFKSPFAAYLIPKDIKIGERVFIEDLIEDYIGASWNQGDTYRLEICEAIWNGTDLEIQYDPKANRSDFIG